jgi:1,2-diacylglycerol 3-beta-galactosyltransferase
MLHIAESLQSSPTPLQMIFICGRNERLAERIRAVRGTKPMLVEGFTDQMDQYMSLSDFFIGKPGPGSLSEALHFRLPVIVERNAKTMPQERYNTDWVKEHEAGMVLTSFDYVDAAVCKLLSDGNLERLRANVASRQNRAVFEVAEILARLMPAENLSDSVEQMKAVLN